MGLDLPDADMFSDVPEELLGHHEKSHESNNYSLGFIGKNVLKEE